MATRGASHRPLQIALLLAFLAPALAGCVVPPTPQPDVVSTVAPVAYLVDQIVGDAVVTGQLVPSTHEPHGWQPTVRDVAQLEGATLLVAQGVGMEIWLRAAWRAISDEPDLVELGNIVLDIDDGSLLGGDDGHGHDDEHKQGEEAHGDEHGHDAHLGEDPHLWLDPVLYGEMAEVARAALVKAFPEHADGFNANASTLQGSLDATHAAYQAGLAECERRTIVVFHDAFSRLAARYNLTQLHVVGGGHEAATDPEHLQEVIEQARLASVTTVFTEGVPSAVMRTVADELDADTAHLYPLDRIPRDAPGETIADLLDHNLETLRAALECT